MLSYGIMNKEADTMKGKTYDKRLGDIDRRAKILNQLTESYGKELKLSQKYDIIKNICEIGTDLLIDLHYLMVDENYAN